MTHRRLQFAIALVALLLAASQRPARAQEVRELLFHAPNDVNIKLRMEGPYTADVPLQIVCYFKFNFDAPKPMSGAPVELDKRLGGVINALRERGDFHGERLETFLIQPPRDSIKAKALLLVGLGDEGDLSPAVLERVGEVSLREAARLGADRVGFAPLIRDQGNNALPAADVESAVLRGMLHAYDTDRRLQAEGLAKPYTLHDWIVEAGPAYFDDTETGVKQAIHIADMQANQRPKIPYRATK